jgi:hypothetical protein
MNRLHHLIQQWLNLDRDQYHQDHLIQFQDLFHLLEILQILLKLSQVPVLDLQGQIQFLIQFRWLETHQLLRTQQ